MAIRTVSLTEPIEKHFTPKQVVILQGASQVFLRSGYAGTSMDRVAAEAGVAKQTIYSHFQDKEGLFRSMIERVTICRIQAKLHMEDCNDEPEILLRQLAETYLYEVADQEYIALIRIVVSESARFPELAKLFTETVVKQGRGLLTEYLKKHPELGLTDPEAVAQLFFSCLVGYVLQQEILYGKELVPIKKERLVDSLIQLILSNQRQQFHHN
jgi:AcrR family transcriptional regulator